MLNHTQRSKAIREAGVSLVELLISLGISMIIILAVITMLSDASRSHMELNKSSQLIENGRFSIQQLRTDLRLAGFYGHLFYGDLTALTTLPDPCITTDAAALYSAMAMPVQGYNAAITALPALTGSTCGGVFLTNSNLSVGSDVLVVRRALTSVVTGTPLVNTVYLQSNVFKGDIQFGDTDAVIPGETADDNAVALFAVNGTTPAQIREYAVRIYFIAPCSSGSNTSVAGGVCQAGDDAIPTLKVLELSGGAAATMTITPLAEGVEYMKLTYGIDNSPTTADTTTGLIGDGVPDIYTATPTIAQWPYVVSVRVELLVKTPQTSSSHVDSKTYTLRTGTTTVNLGPFSDGFKRHVFSTEVKLTNMAGPREIP
ncbi:MAG: PilW family protein [Magnetococcales bacterium]|nr:PilW family protein [Magnetococcales bacterium]